MIKAGLTEDQALAALTINAAELLGVSDRLGSIDNGKIANLTVSDKPYFNEKSKVKYVFVDGQPFKIEEKEVKKEDAAVKPTAIDITGTWRVITDTPQGANNSKVVITKSGGNYTGTVSGDLMTAPATLKRIELDGNNLKYSYSFVMDGGENLDVDVEAVLDGDTYKGTANASPYGSFPLEAKKDPK